jgi:hypothetical protein
LIATLFLGLGIGGLFAATPMARADVPIHGREDVTIPSNPGAAAPCLRINVTIFGTRIGTGSTPICL